MARTSLHQFVARVLAEDRILFGDLKRLQRDILPARITSREEAEILLFLDSAVHRADREWASYLTATVRDFAIWGLDPAGSLDRDKAEWITAALSCLDPTKTARVILREILHEARRIDDDARCSNSGWHPDPPACPMRENWQAELLRRLSVRKRTNRRSK